MIAWYSTGTCSDNRHSCLSFDMQSSRAVAIGPRSTTNAPPQRGKKQIIVGTAMPSLADDLEL